MKADEKYTNKSIGVIIEKLEGAVDELGGDLRNLVEECGHNLKSGHIPDDLKEKYGDICERFCRIAASIVAIERSIQSRT